MAAGGRCRRLGWSWRNRSFRRVAVTIASVRRILFVVNVLIAISLVAAGAAFYWLLYRALPKTSGTIETLVTQPVEVDRDSLGVPHIKARTIEDAWFVEGYTTAEDRMFQMDGLRRLAAGELSAIVGPSALDSDRESRRLRMRRVAEQIYANMPESDKSDLEAYARGVNAYIESHRGRYGVEFLLIGYDPKPWSVVDSLLCGLYMFRELTNTWKNKLIKQQMLRGGEPDKVNFLFPNRSGFEFMPGGLIPAAGAHPGSNAWAVSGAHSATGKPLLANDMHLEFSIPGIWHMEYLEAPGMKVSGVALPGIPGILSGHNDRIAWGETNLGFDVQELYIEKIDLRTGQYLFNGKIEQARAERELIEIRGRPTEEISTWVTRHGPVFQIVDGEVMTLRWSAAEPDSVVNIFPEIDRARDWDGFKRAISRFGGPGQNFVYADVDGNIAYHASGRLPIRRDYSGDAPVDGSSGNFEWQGFIPFDELPQTMNPPDGFIVTANQNPFPLDYPYRVGGSFDSPYRSRQIRDMLRASGNKLKPDDSLRIQKDVYSGFNKFLARQLAAAYGDRKGPSPVFTDAMAMLRTWDGQMDQNRAEPLIVTLAYQYLRKAIAERASPGNGEIYDSRFAPAVVERILRERPATWFGDYDQLLLQSFADGMEEGQRMQGKDPRRWKWGRYMYLAINNPVVSRVPVVGKYFNIGPTPMSGGATTVKQTTRLLGPSERMDASVGDWEASLLNLPIGESGHVASRHYRDQWDAYYNGKSFPMQFNKVNAKSTVTFVPKK
jgi:penicillin amidase